MFSERGVRVDEDKVKAIHAMRPPKDKKSLLRILGMFNYVSKYIPNYSQLSEPLRQLVKNDILFSWNEHCDEAFNKLKDKLTKAPVLGFYNQVRSWCY